MILPQTESVVLMLMILSVVCLGSWAAFYKFAGKWRFELFYLDFALGVMFLSTVLAFTLGDFGYDGFNFLDDLQHAGKRQWLFVFLAGIVFNLGNMILMGAVSISGLAVAFPMAMGVALMFSSVALSHGPANVTLLGLGCLLVLIAVVLSGIGYRILAVAKHEDMARVGKARSTRRPNPWKGIVLGVLAGLLLGVFAPLVDRGRSGELGLGPYAAAFLFAFGIFCSTFVFSIFLMNLPLDGEPIEFASYLNGRPRQHLMGILGGAMWVTGILAAWVASSVPDNLLVDPSTRYALTNGAPVLTALWGLLVFREFKGSDLRLKAIGALTVVFFLCGMAMLGVAPQFLRRG
jgi:glucose uptake protein